MSKFERRHYVVIADIFKELYSEATGSVSVKQLDKTYDAFIREFKRDNYNFKPERFESRTGR